jgi:hypothetical protein
MKLAWLLFLVACGAAVKAAQPDAAAPGADSSTGDALPPDAMPDAMSDAATTDPTDNPGPSVYNAGDDLWEAARWHDLYLDHPPFGLTEAIPVDAAHTCGTTDAPTSLIVSATAITWGCGGPPTGTTATLSGTTWTISDLHVVGKMQVNGTAGDPTSLTVVLRRVRVDNPAADPDDTAAAYAAQTAVTADTLSFSDCTIDAQNLHVYGAGNNQAMQLHDVTGTIQYFYVEKYGHDGIHSGSGTAGLQLRNGTIEAHPYLRTFIQTNGNIHSDATQYFTVDNSSITQVAGTPPQATGEFFLDHVFFYKGQHTNMYMESAAKIGGPAAINVVANRVLLHGNSLAVTDFGTGSGVRDSWAAVGFNQNVFDVSTTDPQAVRRNVQWGTTASGYMYGDQVPGSVQ